MIVSATTSSVLREVGWMTAVIRYMNCQVGLNIGIFTFDVNPQGNTVQWFGSWKLIYLVLIMYQGPPSHKVIILLLHRYDDAVLGYTCYHFVCSELNVTMDCKQWALDCF